MNVCFSRIRKAATGRTELTHVWWTRWKGRYSLREGCSMPRKPYTRYSREFKLEAVRQAALGEKPKAQIARALGIRVGHLRDWRLQFEEEARAGVAKPPPAVGQDPKALSLSSPRQLEESNRRLQNEITERRQIERQLQDLNRLLEHRVAE